jgi:hypothetical protein
MLSDKSDYFLRIKELIPAVIETLTKKGIEERHLQFGGEADKEPKISIPTDARSEFLANRAMGDWAEGVLKDSFMTTNGIAIEISHYGDTDSIAAGEPGFKDNYLRAKEETRRWGKRPDLLIFPAGTIVPDDLTSVTREEADEFARMAIAGIEVRSSKFKADKYMAVRKQDKIDKKTSSRETPSFTVKVEDLKIVFRWIEVVQTQQLYAQVFFDSCFAINVLKIFEYVATASKGFTIDKPEKSQNKATIMIPITHGERLGTFYESPEFGVEVRETRTGRVDAYVRPKGGRLALQVDAFNRLIL